MLSLSDLAKNRRWLNGSTKKLAPSSPSSSLSSREQRRAFGPFPPLLRLLYTMKLVLGFWRMAWSFSFNVSNKHPLLWFCCLISFVLMATLLAHSSSFSILKSTFSIGHLCKAQIVVNPASKRLVSMNTFKFLANYSMVVKIIIISMWCYN